MTQNVSKECMHTVQDLPQTAIGCLPDPRSIRSMVNVGRSIDVDIAGCVRIEVSFKRLVF